MKRQINEFQHIPVAIVGDLLYHTNLHSDLIKRMAKMENPSISNGDVASSNIGLLCKGKSDFDDIEDFREDEFFRYALNIDNVPS
ncbi:IS1380 family transposase, partial [Siminovitchia sp. 179-K 8D1 HS]